MMRFIVLLLMLNAWSASSATATDSVKYAGKWYFIYPIEKNVDQSPRRYSGYSSYDVHEVIFPLANLQDGTYIQLIRFESLDTNQTLKGNFKTTKTKRLPFAVFDVRNGKLNGQAFFFDAAGKVIEYGTYLDNMKTGKWYFGKDLTFYNSYANGVLQGESLVYTHNKRKGDKLQIETTQRWYTQGYLDSSIIVKQFGQTITKTVKLPKTKDNDPKSFFYWHYNNSALVEYGSCSYYDSRKDTCWFFYPESGNIAAKIYFSSKTESLESLRLFSAWKNGLYSSDSSARDLNLYGLHSYSSGYIGNAPYNPTRDAYYGSLDILGDGIQYYENGAKQLSYKTVNDQLYIDTLYYPNGKAKYFCGYDASSGRYMVSHFNSDGEITKRYLVADFSTDHAKLYKGHYLTKEFPLRSEIYSYFFHPDTDTLYNPNTDTVYMDLYIRQDSLFKESYFDTRHRKTYEYIVKHKSKTPYITEKEVSYNESFAQRQVQMRISYDTDFACDHSYVQKANLSVPFDRMDSNLFALDYLISETDWGSIINAPLSFTEYGGGSQNNFHEPLIITENTQTSYTYQNQPYSGKLLLKDVNRHWQDKSKKTNRGMTLKQYNLFYYLFEYDALDHDRFGLQYVPYIPGLIPNLLTGIPGIYAESYSNNLDELQHIYYYSIEKLEGELENGQLHNTWIGYDRKNRPLIRLHFDQGVPVGKAEIYGGYTRKFYRTQSVDFKNGLPEEINYFDSNGDTIAQFLYEDGQPKQAKKTEYGYICGNHPWDPFLDCTSEDIEYGKIYTETAEWQEGKMVWLTITELWHGEWKSTRYACENDFITGLINTPSDSGVINNGYFTGTQTLPDGPRYKKRNVIKNLMTEEKCFSSDGVLLWQIEYDTLQTKIRSYPQQIFELSYWLKYPYEQTARYYNDGGAWGQFQAFYVNGAKSMEGKAIVTSAHTIRLGAWNYYSPDGKLTTQAYYPEVDTMPTFIVDGIEFNYEGDLTQYDAENRPIYTAKILDFYERYNCAEDKNYELRILFIEQDLNSEGNVDSRPTRYHQNFYDEGVLQSEGNLVNGLPHGLWKFYSPDGTLTGMGRFEHGKREGVWFFGDLEGMNFLGEYCMVADVVDSGAVMSQLRREVDITMTTYNNDAIVSSQELKGYNAN